MKFSLNRVKVLFVFMIGAVVTTFWSLPLRAVPDINVNKSTLELTIKDRVNRIREKLDLRAREMSTDLDDETGQENLIQSQWQNVDWDNKWDKWDNKWDKWDNWCNNHIPTSKDCHQ
jgi:hypothetical protein